MDSRGLTVPVASGTLVDGRYRLGPILGRGAMGQVFRAHDDRLDRRVAIKFLRADLATEAGPRERFAHEARSAARLVHPSAVVVFDNGEWNGLPYFTMECLSGRTLGDEIARGRLADDDVRSIAIDIAGALEAAHRLGIVHRDVKPGNILMTDDGRAKLGDFGIAWSNDVRLDEPGLVVGTLAYLAPERIRGAEATAASDLFSLGVVLFEALTGDRPFPSDDVPALLEVHRATQWPSAAVARPDADPRLTNAIDAAMARSPSDRPGSCAAFVGLIGVPADPHVALTVAIAGPPTVPYAMPMDQRTVSTSKGSRRRRRRLAPVVLGLVAALAIVVAMFAGAGGGANPARTTVPPSTVVTSPTPAVTAPQTTAPATIAPPVGQTNGGGRGRGAKDR